MRLASAIDHYLRARVDLAQDTRIEARYILYAFAHLVGRDLAVKSLKRSHVEMWMADQAKRVAASTLRTRLGTIRTFCGWLIASDHLRINPTEGVTPPRQPQVIPRELDDELVTKLLSATPDPRGEVIVLLMVMEGLRRVEVARIRTGDIDWSEHMLLVHGKNSKDRWLPISDQTWEAIHAYLLQHPVSNGPLIRSYVTGRAMMPNTIGSLVRQWMRDAGIKERPWDGKSAHALRHTMAGAMLDEGADIRNVQQALGHSNLSATYRYLQRRQAATQLRECMGRRLYRRDVCDDAPKRGLAELPDNDQELGFDDQVLSKYSGSRARDDRQVEVVPCVDPFARGTVFLAGD